MGKWHGLTLRSLHDAIALLTIVSQLIVAFGLPLPFVRRTSDASVPYPCQFRPCGCASSDLCWKGDCCCFTLEEKLATNSREDEFLLVRNRNRKFPADG